MFARPSAAAKKMPHAPAAAQGVRRCWCIWHTGTQLCTPCEGLKRRLEGLFLLPAGTLPTEGASADSRSATVKQFAAACSQDLCQGRFVKCEEY
mmetsp:Transcript_13799/g.40010  ORF Transcript_13799/g.40010 Transcript_13799/m.40010 type:complete len:94 (+) Transcript_13799:1209-1490(+)